MAAHLWTQLLGEAAAVAAWLNARDPAAVPRWAWAALLVLAAAVAGRVGGRVLAALMQAVLVAAAVLVAWQMVRLPGPVRTAAPAPPACALEGLCSPSAGTPQRSTATAGEQAPQAVQLTAARAG
jgi:hypothetical protein